MPVALASSMSTIPRSSALLRTAGTGTAIRLRRKGLICNFVFPILQNLLIKRKSQFRYFFWSEESQFADLIRLERQAANIIVNHAGSISNQDVRIILLAIEAEQNIQMHVQV